MHDPPLTTSERAIAEAAALGADVTRLRAAVAEATDVMRDDRLWLRQALVYPAFVAMLAVLGTAWIAASAAPRMYDVEDAFRDPPVATPESTWPRLDGSGATVAAAGVMLGIGLAVWIVRLVRHDAGSRAIAARCDVLAELVAGDCPADTGDRLTGEIMSDIVPAAPALPPLAAHALARVDSAGRAGLLRSTAAFYRGLDERRRRTLRLMVPTTACCVAGIAVMLYGLALFRPLVGLVDTLSVPFDAGTPEGVP